MELQIVTFEQAEKLKKLGFDWSFNVGKYNILTKEFHFYTEGFCTEEEMEGYLIPASETSLVLKWLRDVKKIGIYVKPELPDNSDVNLEFSVFFYNHDNPIIKILRKNELLSNLFDDKQDSFLFRKTYEEAESFGLDYVLDYLINLEK